MKNSKINNESLHKWSLSGINAVYVLALCVVLFPLLLIAPYNFPSADDWSYGKAAYRTLLQGGGFFEVLRSVFENTALYYKEWEGRFSNAFLASLQPGIWGEQFYVVVPWIMLGGLIVGELVLFGALLEKKAKGSNYLLVPVVVPSLMLQIMYTPSMSESFYWYTGAINYTFIFACSMVLFALIYKLATERVKLWKLFLRVILACVLSVLIGGDNYATSLSMFVAMVVVCVILWMSNRQGFYRICYLPVITAVSIVACILAPGNATRLNTNFDGGTSGNAFRAIGASFVRSFTNIYSWTNWKILIMILLIIPFVWMAVKYMSFTFRLPVLFTILSFGVYASQITATLYVDGTTGGGRMAAILYYSYHVWVVANLCYWIGWFRKNQAKMAVCVQKVTGRAANFVRRFLLPYCAVAGALMVVMIACGDLKEVSCYRAYRDWRQGWAQQYAEAWEARLDVLHDDTVRVVEFEPIRMCPEAYVYTDLQDKYGYLWVNRDCASYYGKESVMVVDPADVKEQ